jgi:hypothetical protein
MPRLLLLVPTTSYRISDFLGAARRLDVEVTVGSNRRQVLEKFSRGRTVTLDFRNSDKGTKQIIDFARRYPLQAIVAVDEDTTVLAAKASEALGLPHNSPSSVGAAANKYRFRTVLAEAGLPTRFHRRIPRGRSCRGGPSCRISLCPQAASASASRVIRADDPAGFAAAFYRLGKILNDAYAGSLTGTGDYILVEDYIPGTEVALEGLLIGASSASWHFRQARSSPGPVLRRNHIRDALAIARGVQHAVTTATARAVTAWDFMMVRSTPSFGLMKGAGDHRLAARSIGGLLESLRFGVGIPLEELILRHALRLPIESLERDRGPQGS